MPRPRPPSRLDAVPIPLFAMDWFGDPGNGTSILAYCGGGGSAATGVHNKIIVHTAGQHEDLEITTGAQVGVALTLIQHPITRQLYMFAALGSQVHMYTLPSGELVDELAVGDNVNAVAVNPMLQQLAVGCESGTIKVYSINAEEAAGEGAEKSPPKLSMAKLQEYELEGHSKAVCALAYSMHENKLVSSAKDGTARVWKKEECLAELTCSVLDPKGPPPKRTGQILVRGCAFGDLQGNLVYTVASGRRGKAFLSQWKASKGEYQCVERTECSPHPISAMDLATDGQRIVLGATDGTVIIWGIERWRPLKSFPEVHDLPVTCIAARPFLLPLKDDEENGVQMHAVSASADSQLALLTLERRSSRRDPSSRTFQSILHTLLQWIFWLWVLQPVALEIQTKCISVPSTDMSGRTMADTWECIRHDVLWAPDTRPGIAVPPY
eukprot:Nitzschia sp. Nitz4//scaffold11_size288233//17444//18760//NITZ4_000729-RA/size288233-processed-gene-0.199-mRNA-1//-1//CDS//3329533939//5352//frame0